MNRTFGRIALYWGCREAKLPQALYPGHMRAGGARLTTPPRRADVDATERTVDLVAACAESRFRELLQEAYHNTANGRRPSPRIRVWPVAVPDTVGS